MISRRSLLILLSFGAALAAPWACGSGGIGAGPGGGGGSGGSGGGTTTSQGSTAASSSGTPAPSKVGDACGADADCGAGLVCILPTADDPIFNGGPPGGYCSASCALDVDCPADSVCFVGDAGVGNCTLKCSIGPALVKFDDALSPAKCRGRDDVACTPLTSGTDLCLPTCSADSQCPAPLVCDPRASTCAAMATAGLPTGSACNPMQTACSGTCVSFTGSSSSLCSQICVLGGDPTQPTSSPSCGGVSKGVCLFRPSKNGAGDYGFCDPACAKQDDCQNPEFWCGPAAGITGTAGVTNGLCALGKACPNGASDCASSATCTQTIYGPYCLAGDFPLGSSAPVDGGTSDGGLDDGGLDGGGQDDGGTSDGGTSDGSTSDGGTSDGGAADGG
jgi:hypothetical protein